MATVFGGPDDDDEEKTSFNVVHTHMRTMDRVIHLFLSHSHQRASTEKLEQISYEKISRNRWKVLLSLGGFCMHVALIVVGHIFD